MKYLHDDIVAIMRICLHAISLSICQWGEVVELVGYLRKNTVQARTPNSRIHDFFLACLIRYASTAIITQSTYKIILVRVHISLPCKIDSWSSAIKERTGKCRCDHIRPVKIIIK